MVKPIAKMTLHEDGTVSRNIGTTGAHENIGAPPQININFFEQTTKPDAPRALPEGVTFERFDVVRKGKLIASDNRTSHFTVPQFHNLYHLTGASSGWWPLADQQWDSKGLFDECELYALKKDGVPVGFGALQRNVEGQATNKIVFIGLSPLEQGKGLGGALFDQLNHEAWKDTPAKVILDTVPEFDVMQGKGTVAGAAELYLKRGFELVGSEQVTPAELGIEHLNQCNLPKYYEGNASYAAKELTKRLESQFKARDASQKDRS